MSCRFEDLEIWKLGIELTKKLGIIFYNKTFRNYGFQDQIMRATFSITNNIAEGNERGTDKDFARFLYYSKGSVGEVRSMLYIALDLGYLNDEQFDIFKEYCTKISIKIHNLIKFKN